MPPVPVPPIGTPVVSISIRSPIIAGRVVARTVVIAGIVSGTKKDGAWQAHGNVYSCLRFVSREKSCDEDDSENKKELSHNSLG
jgi:hypothetical protein